MQVAKRRPSPRRWALLGILALTSCQTTTDGVRRVADGDDSVLELAWDEYRRPGDRRSVLIVGMTHCAERDYYRLVQSTLDTASIVLMEGTRSDGSRPSTRRDPNAAIRDLASLMDLKMQTDVLVDGANWINADVRDSELGDTAHSLGALLELAVTMMRMRRDKEAARMRAEYPQLTDAESQRIASRSACRERLASSLLTPGNKSPELFARREAHLLGKLDEVLAGMAESKNGDVVLCWGVSHLAGLGEGLVARGFERVGRSWKTAFRVWAARPKDE